MAKYREGDRRCIGRYDEYPGSYAWPEYEYRCPECEKWSGGSDVTEPHDDGTEAVLCPECATLIEEQLDQEPPISIQIEEVERELRQKERP